MDTIDKMQPFYRVTLSQSGVLLLFFIFAHQHKAAGVKTKQNVKQRLQRLLIRCSLCWGSLFIYYYYYYIIIIFIIIKDICIALSSKMQQMRQSQQSNGYVWMVSERLRRNIMRRNSAGKLFQSSGSFTTKFRLPFLKAVLVRGTVSWPAVTDRRCELIRVVMTSMCMEPRGAYQNGCHVLESSDSRL